ncbi:hypothetical protein PDPUS_1_00150 [Photobacterium damselae subsp. piscicida]|uniref:Uncharacterized protein n=1 Tax=Photobacterium damsela subsp. piscicida TaxID=38294 RepID=A0A1V1V7C3_PHODP|nr:hypothetical protein [Photobacterium damselae]MBE8130452.1 hypothetical protein [Photobacterium damselae subsp. piscicida]MDP2544791.1 hypothetical protein [Photobacterium damselae subsp. piscicida]QOD56455.1 hypothetical protein IC627_15025 [Photobacterium damselae subsp. piscicida]BAX51525.1 hypothetical protein PDPUS_1_00150 [Photobacterium damselae subsp. piscicida]GAW44043.1 hypothetical protein PDPJ_1_01457 [Photobacterium damselae subsp. piscicida]
MIINFDLLKEKCSWQSEIHQLNSDILCRHILLNGKVDDLDMTFTFCEQSGSGEVLNKKNEFIGSFSIKSA